MENINNYKITKNNDTEVKTKRSIFESIIETLKISDKIKLNQLIVYIRIIISL